MMTRATTKTLLLVLAAFGAACRAPGPELAIENPDGERVFIDGRLVLGQGGDDDATTAVLPFRYYGATRWDVLPNLREANGIPVFDKRPASVEVELPPPSSPWLFPLDFPLELINRLFDGPNDARITAKAKDAPRVMDAISQEAVNELSERARAARSER